MKTLRQEQLEEIWAEIIELENELNNWTPGSVEYCHISNFIEKLEDDHNFLQEVVWKEEEEEKLSSNYNHHYHNDYNNNNNNNNDYDSYENLPFFEKMVKPAIYL